LYSPLANSTEEYFPFPFLLINLEAKHVPRQNGYSHPEIIKKGATGFPKQYAEKTPLHLQ